MNVKSFHKTVQGESHKRQNKECQDASDCGEVEVNGKKAYFAVVCDGHGGSDYMRSAIGSALGTKVAGEHIKKFLQKASKDIMDRDQYDGRQLRYLSEVILNCWHIEVKKHLTENPFTEAELAKVSEKARKRYTMLEKEKFYSAYGTTMIAVGYSEDYAFGIHLGDGKCVVLDRNGDFAEPIPWDENCFLNATTSMCDSDAINEFRYHYFSEPPAAIFVASDGVDGSFASQEKMYNLYRTMLYSICREGFESSLEEIEKYLPRMSAMGSGDDISIGAIVDMEAVEKMECITGFDPKAKPAPPPEPVKEPELPSAENEAAAPSEEELPETAAETEAEAEPEPAETEQEPVSETAAENQESVQKGLEEDYTLINGSDEQLSGRYDPYPKGKPVLIQVPVYP